MRLVCKYGSRVQGRIAPDHGHALVARLPHDGRLSRAIDCCLGSQARPQGMRTEAGGLQTGCLGQAHDHQPDGLRGHARAHLAVLDPRRLDPPTQRTHWVYGNTAVEKTVGCQ